MAETTPKSVSVNKASEPYVDLGNLLLMDNDPLPWESDKNPSEAQLTSIVRENTQYLFNKLVLLEKERVDEAILVKLPAPEFRLPREKRIPDKREPTKWEEYAKAKGIVKKKKDKKVFDEPSGEWKPRYGYHRANDDTKDWVIEIPDGKDPMADYFGERIQAKKERVAKNELQRMRNVARAQKAKAEAARPPTGLTRPLEDKTTKELEVTMDRAKRATASVGKFQQKIHNEKPVKTGKKRKFLPNEIAKTGTERERALSIVNRLGTKRPKLNEDKAVKLAGREERNDGEGGDASEQSSHDRKSRGRSKRQLHRQNFHEGAVKSRRGGGNHARGRGGGNHARGRGGARGGARGGRGGARGGRGGARGGRGGRGGRK